MKKYLIILITLLINTSLYTQEVNYKQEMRQLIKEVRARAGSSKTIIGNGGVDLYYNGSSIDTKFFSIVDGVLVESVMYGYGGYNVKTPDFAHKNFMNYIEPLRDAGGKILLLDYAEEGLQNEIEAKLKGRYVQENSVVNLSQMYSPNKKGSQEDIESVKDIKNFLVLLRYDKFESSKELLETLGNSDFDLIIMDPYYGKKLFSRFEIERLKTKPNGKKRKVIGYISVGEAETYRKYWNSTWINSPPKWIHKKNPNWENNYIVTYWTEDWKEIVAQMQKQVDLAGFDGYFLDTVDTFLKFQNER